MGVRPTFPAILVEIPLICAPSLAATPGSRVRGRHTHAPMQPTALANQKREWEEIARQDAFWAILSYSDRKFGAWSREDFFRTGEEDVEAVMRRVDEFGRPAGRATALDFGCGVGRVTRALSAHFEHCLGLDISEKMVTDARALNEDRPGCTFEVNDQ